MEAVTLLGSLAIPGVVGVAALLLLLSRRPLLDAFVRGAEQGLKTAVHLLPMLVLLMTAVGMLSASGLPDTLGRLLRPIGDRLGIPMELLPLCILRPVSGSGSNALLLDLFSRCGVDSFPSLCASVLMGSSETLLYVAAVYYSSVGIRRTRQTLPIAFFVMLVCILLSCALCRLLLF